MAILTGCKVAVLLSLLIASDVLAAPQKQDDGSKLLVTRQSGVNSSACAPIGPMVDAQRAANPRVTPSVPASMAIACLRSVPNKPAPAAKLVTSLKAYTQWQSTHAWLKDPPAGYMLPAVDIMAQLDNFSSMATAGMFESEYDFQANVTVLYASAHDGHFGYRGDIFKAFNFRADAAADIVSISSDGKQVPKLYHLAALMANNQTGASRVMPPAITKINGRDAATVIEESGLKFVNFQDPDSQWNAQLPSYAVPITRPVISSSLLFQGSTLTLEYDNGQTNTTEYKALVRTGANFTGVNTGEDFYNRFCNPETAVPTTGGSATVPTTPTNTTAPTVQPQIPGFPMPEIRDNGSNITAGYFLKGAGYEDVAVLSVLGFAPEDPAVDPVAYLQNYQKVVGGFLAKSKAAGKTKLVVDLSGNGGGIVVAGYDLYSQLFPGQALFQADNLRATDSLQAMARMTFAKQEEILSLDINNIRRNSSTADVARAVLQSSSVVSNLIPAAGVFKPDGKAFANTEELIAPVTLKGDKFTAYQNTPLNDTSSEFNLTGTGTQANPPPAVFAPENIVLLTDGTCGSTCTLFSYLMIMQNNVKTVVVGGRPNTGPMQSIAGVEGAQVMSFNDLQESAAALLILSTPAERTQMNGSELATIAEGYAIDRSAAPSAAGSVNAKNAFSHADAETPLQFLYQAANCRFFYTADMVMGPEATWKRAVDATFTNPNQFCVDGSIMPSMGVVDPSSQFFNNANAQPNTVAKSTGGRSFGGSSGMSMWIVALVGAVFLVW